ncbi:hypothetical protein [Enterobacter kobei]|uniref:hypothetical protein n=1 Tax=Enterobacter kobei TaxID=208224 RepID=UPI001F18ACEA|nr:hypothetical protein [Enterobacter kobei]
MNEEELSNAIESITSDYGVEEADEGDHGYYAYVNGGYSPVIPDWQAKAERLAELHGSSFVVFRNGESPQCADPTKVIISFTDEGLGHGSAAPQQEVTQALTKGMERYGDAMQELAKKEVK